MKQSYEAPMLRVNDIKVKDICLVSNKLTVNEVGSGVDIYFDIFR